MTRPPFLRALFGTLVFAVLTAGCSPPAAPTRSLSPLAPPPAAGPLFVPAVDGLVREVDGGPIGGATVRAWAPSGSALRTVVSGADGRFSLPALENAGAEIRLGIVKLDAGRYVWSHGVVVPAAASPAPVFVELKAQPVVLLHEARPIDIELTGDDLYLGYDEHACGPCKLVWIKRPLETTTQVFEIRLHASAAEPLRVLLVGSENYDQVLLDQITMPPGSTDLVMRVTRIQLESSQYDPAIYLEQPVGRPPVRVQITLAPAAGGMRP